MRRLKERLKGLWCALCTHPSNLSAQRRIAQNPLRQGAFCLHLALCASLFLSPALAQKAPLEFSANSPTAEIHVNPSAPTPNADTVRALPSQPTITIGYAASLEPAFYIDVMVPLIEKLKRTFPNASVKSRELNLSEGISPERVANIDLLLLSGAEARMVSSPAPLSMATLTSGAHADVNHTAGSVFITAADSTIKTIRDMRGKRAAANDAQSFDGWLIAMNELVLAHQEPQGFFKSVTYTHWQYPDVITLVLAGVVDVGILPTCSLEKAAQLGALPSDSIRVVGERTEPGERCRRSTPLFPGIQLLALPHVDPAIVKRVMTAVMTLPPMTDGSEWLPNNNTAAVDELLKNLHLGPFAYLETWSWPALWERFRFWILTGSALIVLLVVDLFRVNRIVKRRTAALLAESAARLAADRALETSQRRLDLLERASAVSQLSAMIAHDLKQPLTIIVNYLNGLALLIREGRGERQMLSTTIEAVLAEAYRLSDIIERVRALNRREWAPRERIDLRVLLSRVLDVAKLPISLKSTHTSSLIVLGNALELELVIINLLRNANTAAKSAQEGGAVTVTLTAHGQDAVLFVDDNGPPISNEVFESLGQITRSSKPDGMGYGLAIAHSIVEAHGGHLSFERLTPQGLRVTVVLPLATENSDAHVSVPAQPPQKESPHHE